MKRVKFFCVTLCGLLLMGCLKQNNKMNGAIIITENLTETKEIIYRNFDESTITINDSTIIKQICSLIQEGKYRQLEDELIGMYHIDFVTNTETISIGFDQHHLFYDGKLYECCDDTDFGLILKLLGIGNFFV